MSSGSGTRSGSKERSPILSREDPGAAVRTARMISMMIVAVPINSVGRKGEAKGELL